MVAPEHLALSQQCTVPPSLQLALIPTIFLSHHRVCFGLYLLKVPEWFYRMNSKVLCGENAPASLQVCMSVSLSVSLCLYLYLYLYLSEGLCLFWDVFHFCVWLFSQAYESYFELYATVQRVQWQLVHGGITGNAPYFSFIIQVSVYVYTKEITVNPCSTFSP